MSQHNTQQGFLTIAQNTDTVNYLELAFVQAMNIKCTQKIQEYAVIVDKNTEQQITEEHRKVFDHVIVFENDLARDHDWKLANEYQVFSLTPFKETIKLESDLLFTRSIDHWWTAFRLKDIVLNVGCKTYKGTTAESRFYRRFFDDNSLPDVYNGLMYFRYSQTSFNFFNLAKQISDNWTELADHALLNCREPYPSTDVLYAVTASVFGKEQCTLPKCDFLNFVHMKPEINGLPDKAWFDSVMSERDGDMIRVNNLNQYYPVHYYDKTYITRDIINDYKQRCSGILGRSSPT
jgi:hypothetical protein